MGTHRTSVAAGPPQTKGRSTTCAGSSRPDWDSVRLENRLSLGVFAAGDGLRLRHDLLASSSRLARGGRLGEDPVSSVGRTGRSRRDRLVEVGFGQLLGPSRFGGAKTGPNPTDRGKNGSKRHLLTDGNGTPLSIAHTAANVHDSEMAIPLVDAVAPIKTSRGGRRKRPAALLADRAYDAEDKIRKELRRRRIDPLIARRNTEHGSGLGQYRYVVEACFEWLFQWRRLRVRYEKRDDIHDALLSIGCSMICWNRISALHAFC